MASAVFLALGILTLLYLRIWATAVLRGGFWERRWPSLTNLLIGFVTNVFDTLGVGNFATTTSIFKLGKIVRDEQIPGTLNVGHALPTMLEAFLYLGLIKLDALTLISLISASAIGAWYGAGVVSRWPRSKVQNGMGSLLILAACLMLMSVFHLGPSPGAAIGLTGLKLAIGILGNAILGALMTIGIGLYAPCMVLLYFLGMNPLAAYPYGQETRQRVMPSTNFVVDAWSGRSATLRG